MAVTAPTTSSRSAGDGVTGWMPTSSASAGRSEQSPRAGPWRRGAARPREDATSEPMACRDDCSERLLGFGVGGHVGGRGGFCLLDGECGLGELEATLVASHKCVGSVDLGPGVGELGGGDLDVAIGEPLLEVGKRRSGATHDVLVDLVGGVGLCDCSGGAQRAPPRAERGRRPTLCPRTPSAPARSSHATAEEARAVRLRRPALQIWPPRRRLRRRACGRERAWPLPPRRGSWPGSSWRGQRASNREVDPLVGLDPVEELGVELFGELLLRGHDLPFSGRRSRRRRLISRASNRYGRVRTGCNSPVATSRRTFEAVQRSLFAASFASSRSCSECGGTSSERPSPLACASVKAFASSQTPRTNRTTRWSISPVLVWTGADMVHKRGRKCRPRRSCRTAGRDG